MQGLICARTAPQNLIDVHSPVELVVAFQSRRRLPGAPYDELRPVGVDQSDGARVLNSRRRKKYRLLSDERGQVADDSSQVGIREQEHQATVGTMQLFRGARDTDLE